MNKTLEEIVSDYYILLGVTIEKMRLSIECLNRENVSSDFAIDKNEVKILKCPHNKEHFHIYSLKFKPGQDYPLANQISWLDGIRTKIALGEYGDRAAEYLTLNTPIEVELDIMVRGAEEYVKEAKISRRELMKWYVCERKIRYASSDDEQLIALQKLKPELHSYLCPYDNSHYHLGHRSHWRKNSSRAAKNAYLMHKKREKKKQEKLRKASST